MAQLPQSRRTWIVGGAAGAVALIAMSWLGLIGPELASTSSLKNQTSDAQTQNFVLRSKVTTLQAQDKKLPALKRQLAALEKQLPSDSGMSSYIRQVMKQADSAGVTLTSVTAGSPTVAVVGGGVATVQVASPAGHLFSIPVNIVGDGSLTQQRALLKAIQNNGPRRALLTSVAFSPPDESGSGGNTIQSIDRSDIMTLQLQVFVAPQTPADEAALKQQIAGN